MGDCGRVHRWKGYEQVGGSQRRAAVCEEDVANAKEGEGCAREGEGCEREGEEYASCCLIRGE